MSFGKTAVLFFSYTLNDEYGVGSFGLNRKGFSNLYKFFVNKALKTVEEAGLPLIEAYSNQQIGDTFSERLINSLKSVSDKGFERVIIIGNDAPQLSVGDVLSAKTALDEGLNVLGKDKRGGVYLIGLDLKTFNSAPLRVIQWHSSHVYRQLSEVLGDVYELSERYDINRIADLKSLLNVRGSLTLGIRRFLMFIVTFQHKVTRTHLFINFFIFEDHLDRGPPRLAF